MSGYVYGASKKYLRPGVRTITKVDPAGRVIEYDTSEVKGMTSPVRCFCGGTYDLDAVHVTERYSDCSVWMTPCCNRKVDDRPPWPGMQVTFTRLDRA